MGIKQGESRFHWNYFLALESDVQNLSRYVEFCDDNWQTYSIEIAHLMLSVCSEVDIVAKIICAEAGEGSCENMRDFRMVLDAKYSRISSMQVQMPQFGLTFTPWQNWDQNKKPNWWQAYQDVKHNRDTEYPKANLKNLLNAISGLFVLLVIYHKKVQDLRFIEPIPQLLEVDGDIAYIDILLSGGRQKFLLNK